MQQLLEYKTTFENNGFVLLKDFFSIEESENIVRYADELQEWKEEKFKWMLYYEKNRDKNNNKKKARMEHFINYHSEINQVLDSLKETIEFIYGEKLNLFKDKINWKYGGGEGFKAHQDQPAWTDFAPSRYVTLALFANNTKR